MFSNKKMPKTKYAPLGPLSLPYPRKWEFRFIDRGVQGTPTSIQTRLKDRDWSLYEFPFPAKVYFFLKHP
jgi:hypothetical protein